MNTIELSYDEKRECMNDQFCSFVEHHGDYSLDEINHLQATIHNKKLSKILYASATLAVWSMTAAWIDAVLLPLLIIYAISLPGAVYYPILFPIAWTILNGVLKFFYIKRRLGGAITFRDNLFAVFPYAGAAFLLKNWFVGDPLLKNASLAYIAHRKKQIVQKILLFIRGGSTIK